jgi:hypothetical protein
MRRPLREGFDPVRSEIRSVPGMGHRFSGLAFFFLSLERQWYVESTDQIVALILVHSECAATAERCVLNVCSFGAADRPVLLFVVDCHPVWHRCS